MSATPETQAQFNVRMAQGYADRDARHAAPRPVAYFWYIVEVTGQPTRYAGSDFAEAVSAVASIVEPDEGYVVAEIDGVYSFAESDRVECAAMAESFGGVQAIGRFCRACSQELPLVGDHAGHSDVVTY